MPWGPVHAEKELHEVRESGIARIGSATRNVDSPLSETCTISMASCVNACSDAFVSKLPAANLGRCVRRCQGESQ